MRNSAGKLLAVDPRSLAVLRIGIAALLLIDLWYRAIDLEAHYTNSGVLPDAALIQLLRDFLSPRLFELGLICRVEDKREPVIQLAPPLIAGPEEFREIGTILRTALSEASDIMSS